MNSFEKLVEIFKEFPGIGERQARRFAFFALSKPESYLKELSTLLLSIKKDVVQCPDCLRFFSKRNQESLCTYCADTLRDKTTLLVVSKDADLLAIEKSSLYHGHYVVIGGLIPILEKNPERKIRITELLKVVTKRHQEGLKEIIFALSATSEGEHTKEFIIEKLAPLGLEIAFSELGRGLSTGTELEYADPETIRAALQNKK